MEGVIRISGWPDGDCVKDNTFKNIQGRHMLAGQCFCKEGFTGTTKFLNRGRSYPMGMSCFRVPCF